MVVLSILAILIEFCVVLGAAAVFGPLPVEPPVYVLAHVVACGLFAVGQSALAPREDRRGMATLLFLFALPLPLLGMFMAAVMDWMTHRTGKRGVFDEFKDYVKMNAARFHGEAATGEAILAADRSTQPLVDIIADADPPALRAAIERLSLHNDPHTIQTLRGFLSSEEDAVRLQASASLSRIEARLNDAVFHAKERADLDPTATRRIELAESYRRLCQSGLLDDMTRRHYLQRACEQYEAVLETNGQYLEAVTGYAQILIERGNEDRAVEVLEPAVEQRPDDAPLRRLLCHAYFGLGRYREIRDTLTVRADLAPAESEFGQLVALWAPQEEAS